MQNTKTTTETASRNTVSAVVAENATVLHVVALLYHCRAVSHEGREKMGKW